LLLWLSNKYHSAFAPGFLFEADYDEISKRKLVGDISNIVEFIDNDASGK